jgi:hypothetical protein
MRVVLERELLMAQVAFAAGAIKNLVDPVLGETHMYTCIPPCKWLDVDYK